MVDAVSAHSQGLLTKANYSHVADAVEIFAEAQELSQTQRAQNVAFEAKVAYYQQFRPTHGGFSSYNLSLGIVDPGTQPFSQNRYFADVARAARESINKNCRKLEDIGRPYDYTYAKSEDNYSLFGEFDRRALYAVVTNEGGLFTEHEQKQARNIMRGQQGMAMGLYHGPSALKGSFVGSPGNHQQSYKSGIQFMDRVSLEEKATDVEWAHQRAAMQWSYENQMREGNGITENFNVDHPLVNLILDAIEAWRDRSGLTSDGYIGSADELRNELWFEGYADRLDSAIAQTRELHGLAEP